LLLQRCKIFIFLSNIFEVFWILFNIWLWIYLVYSLWSNKLPMSSYSSKFFYLFNSVLIILITNVFNCYSIIFISTIIFKWLSSFTHCISIFIVFLRIICNLLNYGNIFILSINVKTIIILIWRNKCLRLIIFYSCVLLLILWNNPIFTSINLVSQRSLICILFLSLINILFFLNIFFNCLRSVQI
jgi:hypothetical protein